MCGPAHPRQVGIEPQLYGLRWTRLLFCREFDATRLHRLWDPIFAASFLRRRITTGMMTARVDVFPPWTIMECVEWVCTAMVRSSRGSCCARQTEFRGRDRLHLTLLCAVSWLLPLFCSCAYARSWCHVCARRSPFAGADVTVPLGPCVSPCPALRPHTQLLHVRERLLVNDYSEMMIVLMRYPEVSDPFELFHAAVHLAENGGRVRPVTPPPTPPVRKPRAGSESVPAHPHTPQIHPAAGSRPAHFRAKLVLFYREYVPLHAFHSLHVTCCAIPNHRRLMSCRS